MAMPIISYASPAWYPNIGNKRKLEASQKAACRWILSDYESPYRILLSKLKILPITYYLEINDLLFLSKVVNGYYDTDWSSHYTLITPSRPTRHGPPQIFDVKRPRLAKTAERYFHRVPLLANNLLIDITDAQGLKQKLIALYWHTFHTSYDELNPCTWTARCTCSRHS